MWISSLVATLPSDDREADRIVDAIAAIPVFTPGERCVRRLPIVIEAEDGQTARHWYEWVEALPGVEHVELAFVSFDEPEDPTESNHQPLLEGATDVH